MKTKRIEFDLPLVQKVASGQRKGRIVTRKGQEVRVVCWDRRTNGYPLVSLCTLEDGEECIVCHDMAGKCDHDDENGLMIEISNDASQLPFERVLVRNESGEPWKPKLFSFVEEEDGIDYPYHMVDDTAWAECIPYEGNEEMAGTSLLP